MDRTPSFGFGEVKPTAVLGRVVPFEALDQPPGLGRRKGLVEQCLAVDIEIVLDQHDGLDVREVAISQILQDPARNDLHPTMKPVAILGLVGIACEHALIKAFDRTQSRPVTQQEVPPWP